MTKLTPEQIDAIRFTETERNIRLSIATVPLQVILDLATEALATRERAASYILEISNDQIGAGCDPVGFLIASHRQLAARTQAPCGKATD